jgi:hypothetical protein
MRPPVRIISNTVSPFTPKVRIVALEREIPIGDDSSALIDSPLIAAWLDAQGEGEELIPAN